MDVLLYLALFWSIRLLGLPWLLSGKESANAGEAGDAGSIPGSGRSLEKEMAARSSVLAWEVPQTGAWRATVHGVTKSRTRLSDQTTKL